MATARACLGLLAGMITFTTLRPTWQKSVIKRERIALKMHTLVAGMSLSPS